jgi:hypothetical protein
MDSGLLGLVTVGNQATDDVTETVDWAAMRRVLNLRHVFALVDDRFDKVCRRSAVVGMGGWWAMPILWARFSFSQTLAIDPDSLQVFQRNLNDEACQSTGPWPLHQEFPSLGTGKLIKSRCHSRRGGNPWWRLEASRYLILKRVPKGIVGISNCLVTSHLLCSIESMIDLFDEFINIGG